MGFGLVSFVFPSYMIYFFIEGIDSSIICSEYAPDIIVDSEAAMKFYTFIDRIEAGKIMSMVWITGIIVYIISSTAKYIKAIYTIKKYSMPATGKTVEIFESIEKGKGGKNVELLMNPKALQPYTIGVRNKYIVFPLIFEKLMSDDEIKLIFMHEIIHAEKNDAFLKIFIEILNGINWFNPFFYKIKKEYCFWTEACCDEELNQSFDKKTRIIYVNLLIKVAEINVKYKSYAASFLALKKTNSIKRRAELIMKNKKKGTKFATVAMSFMALCVFCGAGYAAKEADYAVYGVFGSDKNIVREGEFDVLTVDEAENLIEADNNVSEETQDNIEQKHIHKWVNTLKKKHKKYSDGSCMTTYYHVKLCEECGRTETGDVYKRESFEKCPH